MKSFYLMLVVTIFSSAAFAESIEAFCQLNDRNNQEMKTFYLGRVQTDHDGLLVTAWVQSAEVDLGTAGKLIISETNDLASISVEVIKNFYTTESTSILPQNGVYKAGSKVGLKNGYSVSCSSADSDDIL